MILVKIE